MKDLTYRIVLFGHRDFSGHRILDKYFYPLLKELFRQKTFVEIYVGRNGEFDLYAASIVKRIQKELGNENNELICVLPYANKNAEYYFYYYDSVIIPDCLVKTHPKAAIQKRNQWMVEHADLIICYVEHEYGGAYRALKYAKQLYKPIINFAQEQYD